MIMDYEGFKKEILNLSGIDLSAYKEKQMKRRLDALIQKNLFKDYQSYVNAVKENKDLYEEFINYMTINVSEFYRNPEQWEKLKKNIIPLLLEKNKSLKVWSAACSSGDEPYTLAMIMSEMLPPHNIKIIATDIDKTILSKAKKGLYTDRSLLSLPKEYLRKHFTLEGSTYKINDNIKSCVEFKHHNLLSDPYPEECDLIVCRNVLIYFTEEAKSEIYKKFNKALKHGGVLFVGSTEQIILYNNYRLRPLQTFFYQKESNLIV